MGNICDGVIKVAPGTSIANSTTDFFTAKSFPVNAKIITFTVVLDTATTLSLRDATNGSNFTFLAGANLVANAAYTFTFVADPALTYTFRSGAACTVKHMYGVASLE